MNSRLQAQTFFLIKAALLLLTLLSGPIALAGTTEPPPWNAITRDGLYQVTLGPQEGSVRINAMQKWVVEIKDSRGVAVTNARVLIDGGMRAHGHGLPTKPQITQHLGEGRYLIEGVRLNMVGEWTLMIGVELNGRRDVVTFDIEIDY